MSAAIPKTKRNLIEIARQLFAKKGVDGTTMNEIAEASGYGRRTLYTYFKNKKDIYKAVIGSELEKLYASLEDVI
ncbi:MAG TPA: TetR/AcrR family transcriptional regulator, partial [Flavihumibacter sp.]